MGRVARMARPRHLPCAELLQTWCHGCIAPGEHGHVAEQVPLRQGCVGVFANFPPFFQDALDLRELPSRWGKELASYVASTS